MSLMMQLRRIVILMIIEYVVPSLAVNYPSKEYQIIYVSVHIYLGTCTWETNTHARVNLYEMSTYKSCWSWRISQFSTCMSLLRHCCQGNSFWNSQTDSKCTLSLSKLIDNSGFQIPFKTSCNGHRWLKAKDFFVFCSGKICLAGLKINFLDN